MTLNSSEGFARFGARVTSVVALVLARRPRNVVDHYAAGDPRSYYQPVPNACLRSRSSIQRGFVLRAGLHVT